MERMGATETSCRSSKPTEQGDKELPNDPQDFPARQRHSVLGTQDGGLANALQQRAVHAQETQVCGWAAR